MERVGVFFKLKEGMAEPYEKAHNEIWEEMMVVLNDSGIKNYSIWNLGEMLFSYYEVEDKKKMESVLTHSDVYKRWRDYMEEFIYIEPESGKKEWFMKMVFYKD